MEKLRIAVDGRPALWNTMGIGTVVYNFIKHIQEIDSSNDYTFFFDAAPAKLTGLLSDNNFKFKCNLNKLVWTNVYMPLQFYKGNYDLYITFLDRDVPLFNFGTKKIALICDLIPLIYATSFFKSSLHQLYYKMSIRHSIMRSDKILTISSCSKNDLLRYFPIDEEKVRVIDLGSSEPAKDNKIEVLTKYRIKGKYILAFGSTEPRKNNVRLIQAFNILPNSISDVHLVIIGKEWRGLKFDDGLLHGKIILTGYVPDEDIPYLYKNAELVAFPSLYEGFGLPVLEAMTYGVPVVTSNGSSLPEVGGDAVAYVDPNDVSAIASAIKNILDDKEARKTRSEKGLLRAKQFTWQSMCKQIIAVCEEVVH